MIKSGPLSDNLLGNSCSSDLRYGLLGFVPGCLFSFVPRHVLEWYLFLIAPFLDHFLFTFHSAFVSNVCLL